MEDDDARHKQEQAELRAKRKAAKISKSEARKEKDRKQQEHRQKILKQVAGSAAKDSDSSKGSAFRKLFEQRAKGFHVEFRFRNAPPRPPVGPCYVGNTLEHVLQEECRTYKDLNNVEVNHRYQLHAEPDLGVPLAPSAINIKSYPTGNDKKISEKGEDLPQLAPADAALLDWKGPLGDTAADELKLRQDQARATARAIAQGQKIPTRAATSAKKTSDRPTKKPFSRVLDEDMQTWMKKTTYLSNDYTRKVHDFKSLAQSKNELAQDLQLKQQDIAKRRSTDAVNASFSAPIVHPHGKKIQTKTIYNVLPSVSLWGKAFTHTVIDKPPATKEYNMNDLNAAMIADVEKQSANARMMCQLVIPHSEQQYRSISSYNLDIIPLKEENSPHMHFCLWLDEDKKSAQYIPIASRVQLSTGRPPKTGAIHEVSRRSLTEKETREIEERMAEVDEDMAEKHHVVFENDAQELEEPAKIDASSKKEAKLKTEEAGSDDSEDDFGDDDSSDSGDDMLFGGAPKTIVAEG